MAIQEERSVFWEVIVSVVVEIKNNYERVSDYECEGTGAVQSNTTNIKWCSFY